MDSQDILDRSSKSPFFFEEKGQLSRQPFNLDISNSAEEFVSHYHHQIPILECNADPVDEASKALQMPTSTQSIKLGPMHHNIHRLVIRLMTQASKMDQGMPYHFVDLHQAVNQAKGRVKKLQGSKFKNNEASISMIIVEMIRQGKNVSKLQLLILQFVDDKNELPKCRLNEHDRERLRFFVSGRLGTVIRNIEKLLAEDKNTVIEPHLLKNMWRKRNRNASR